ncbi:GNAT family N-acetyltransferase [Merismopedia glauca]|uniref:FemAB family protein n=1 Tax=Merismopedia glauca CCAP 1448/3 TaxID=1296344 RepID=A0A2T1C0U7_9CYAN|nr:GNAT family N-acetyltransferase [Merismopedia glauca]PSB01889.1 FemAB family protein [Merismopedia glauca CCAP 1448/3]
MNSQIIDPKNSLWQETLNNLRHDIYHLPEYVAIEAVRNDSIAEAFLLVDKDRIFFLPYLVRSCQNIALLDPTKPPIFDIISPYGYPSLLLSETAISTSGFADAALQEFKETLKRKSICSAFIRLHPILSQGFEKVFAPETLTFNGETISVDLTLSIGEIWAHTRKGHQSTINKCKRTGFTGKMVPLGTHIDQFMEVYQQTMQRVSAKEFYYFDRHYFEALAKLNDRIHLCLVELSGQLASACILFECDRIVQAHLGATKDEFLPQSPFNLLLDYVRYWAKERGNTFLHLGGGVGSNKDGVYHFKSGFSRQKHNFWTLRMIIDEEKYNYLVDCHSQTLNVSPEQLQESNFFPAYRAL